MPHEMIRLEIASGIGWITVDRPEKRNALSSQVRAEIIQVLADMRENDDVRVVVLTGAGEKAFVAGADIAEFAARTPEEQREAMAPPTVFDVVATYPKPTIAMINGFALGGGCELALACDIRIASDTARLGQPEINLGLIPGGGGTQRMTRLVGRGAALRLMLTGEIIDAAEAYRIGLLDRVVSASDLRVETERIAGLIAERSPLAVRLVKEAVRTAESGQLADGLQRERELFIEAFESDDSREGIAAFLEKRTPRFTGR